MYREFIKRKFPHNESIGLYVAPNLPGSKLGKILMKETRVKQPGDVVAMYLESGIFSTTYLILTESKCYYDGGAFDLETLRGCKADGRSLEFMITGMGSTYSQRVKLGEDKAASAIAKVLDDLAYYDEEKEQETAADPKKYAAYEGQALDWLMLRDEVMRTIDMLYERFQDGKLSLLEFESKKAELLERL